MTDYQVYGARHFLRSADPEAASELRRRYDYLTNGQVLPPKTPWADIDRFRLDGILDYRTLVLRRGPLSSRPPSVYRLVRSGRYYEVWQRPAQAPSTIVEHLGLDTSSQPARVPACSEVMRLANEPGVASLAAATRPQTIWLGAPPLSGERDVTVSIPKDGEYFAWLGGDWYGDASISVDGHEVGSRREELNWPGLYTELGRTRLAAGQHVVDHPARDGRLAPRQRRRAVLVRPGRAQPGRRPRAGPQSARLPGAKPVRTTARLGRGVTLTAA